MDCSFVLSGLVGGLTYAVLTLRAVPGAVAVAGPADGVAVAAD